MFTVGDNQLLNLYIKEYVDKPIIEAVDWTDALKWKAKSHNFIRAYSNTDVFCTSDALRTIDKPQC